MEKLPLSMERREDLIIFVENHVGTLRSVAWAQVSDEDLMLLVKYVENYPAVI